jgi:hypothetical protein
MFKPDSRGITFHGTPDRVGCHSNILPSTTFRNAPEYFTASHSQAPEPSVNQSFTPDRHRHRSQLTFHCDLQDGRSGVAIASFHKGAKEDCESEG